MKENNKKMQSSIKELENEKKEDKGKYMKVHDLLREKEKELVSRDDVIRTLEQKYEHAVAKLKQEIKEIQG